MGRVRTGIGQSIHRFLSPETAKPCVIGGVMLDDVPGFQSDSDGDVVFYALCKAISSISHTQIISGIADELFQKEGITDSAIYLKEAVKTLKSNILHVAITLEAKKPRFKEHFTTIRKNISVILGIKEDDVGISAVYGDGLTDCGCGEGVSCFAVITVEDRD